MRRGSPYHWTYIAIPKKQLDPPQGKRQAHPPLVSREPGNRFRKDVGPCSQNDVKREQLGNCPLQQAVDCGNGIWYFTKARRDFGAIWRRKDGTMNCAITP